MLAALAALGLCAGCAIAPPAVDPLTEIAAAAPAGAEVAFRSEGAPLDEGESPTQLSLEEALRLALRTDPGLAAALARVRAAYAEAAEAGMPPDPLLDVVLRWPAGSGGLQVDAGLSAGLVELLRTPRLASAAHHRLRAESSRALGTALDLIEDVQTRYATIAALESLASLLDERRATAQRLLEAAQARLDAGEGTRAEAVIFQAEVLALEIERAGHATELRRERLGLARLIGQPSSEAAWELAPLAPLMPPPTHAPAVAPAVAAAASEADWIAAALARRPEILAAEWELLALGDEAAVASSGAFDATSVGVAAQREDGWSVGPSLAVPLPLSDRAEARSDAALARQIEGRHRLTEARRAAIEDVRASLSVLDHSLEALARLQAELIPLQEQRRADVQRAFAAQQLPVTAVLQVDRSLQEARMHRVELERQVRAAGYRLQRAVGGPASAEAVATPVAITAPSPSPGLEP